MSWNPPPAAPKDETAQQWADRVLAEHGPPPQRLVDHVRRLRTTTRARKRTA